MSDETLQVEFGGKKYFFHKSMLDALNKFEKKRRKFLHIYMSSSPYERELINLKQTQRALHDNRVWARVRVGNTEFNVAFDERTHSAYKVDWSGNGYKWTWMKWKKFEFVKFLVLMDL